jgi:uncharacterized protein
VLPKSDDQGPVVAFLSNPTSYGGDVDRVEVVETHISLVFLAGDRAYKLKRSVKYPYLDFSTEARRRRACEAELNLNRRTAPQLYLEVRPLCQTEGGAICWGKADPVIDWVVVMLRFDQENLFDSLAQRGALGPRLMLDLVDHLVWFHAGAERLFGFGGSAAMAAIEQENMACLGESAGSLFAPEHIADLHARSVANLNMISELLDERRAAGKVRRCHGDLHLRNICLLEAKPVLFDCIEFSDELASIDVLYDLTFLLMDLEHRDLRGLANLAFNRYLDLTDDDEALSAVPLFMSLRAAVRAHVTALAIRSGTRADRFEEWSEEARRFLDLARAVLEPQPQRLVAIGGLSGTGKTTVARALAPMLGTRPGARLLRSDVIRKRLWGVMPETPLPAAAYQESVSYAVYDVVRKKAAAALGAGYCVVIDAVSLAEQDRRSFVAVAEEAHVRFAGIWLEANPATMVARIGARQHDVSDASIDVLHHQMESDPGPIDWERVDANGDSRACLAVVLKAVDSTDEPNGDAI